MSSHKHHSHASHKNDDHSSHIHDHGSGTRLLLVIIFNAIITAAEYVGGIMSGSLALISDAGHNLSDVLSLMLGYAGEKVSESDPSKKYSFGLKRFEVLVALINALSLIVIGIYIVYEAVHRFMDPVSIDLSIMLPVGAIGLAGNLLSIIALLKSRKKNINLKAAFLHLLYDTISSVAVIIAGVIIYVTGLYWIDVVISLIIVTMIAWSSMGIIRESYRIFLQGTPAHIDSDEIYRSLLEMDNVGSIHGLHIWSINSSEVFLSCHICVHPDADTVETDTIIKDVNNMLKETYGIDHTTLQVEMENLCSLENRACCR